MDWCCVCLMVLENSAISSANYAISRAMTKNTVSRRQFDHLWKQLRQTRAEMRRRVGDRDRQIAELSRKISDQDRTLGELNRRVVEFDQRCDDIFAEVTRARVAEDLHIKQKCISITDVPSTSSAGDIPLPKQSAGTVLSGPETSTECKPSLAMGSAFDHSRPVSISKPDSRKRKGSVQVCESKHSKKTDSSSAAKDACCLRSGRQVFCD